MVENLIEIYFSSEIDINIHMKFDKALKPRIILEYMAIRIIISSISAGVCEWGFLIFLSILLSEICLNIHILPFIKSRYSLKFHAQIAANGDSGSLDFKIFRGSSPGPPPPHIHRTRTFGAGCEIARPLASSWLRHWTDCSTDFYNIVPIMNYFPLVYLSISEQTQSKVLIGSKLYQRCSMWSSSTLYLA